MSDNLQEIVDGLRVELRACGVVHATIQHPTLAEPLYLDIVPDGFNSLVRVVYGDRMIANTAQRPDVIINELYTFLRACLREALAPTPPARPS